MLTSNELERRLDKVRQLESRLTFRLAILSKQLDQQASELLKDTPLNLTAYRVLNVVSTFDRISISDLSRYNGIDRAQASRTVDSLHKQGFVDFADDPKSKRKKLVLLTDAGRRLFDVIHPKFLERNKMLVEKLGPEAYDGLSKGLTKLADIMSD